MAWHGRQAGEEYARLKFIPCNIKTIDYSVDGNSNGNRAIHISINYVT